MTDIEFDVLDELYFVQDFDQLRESLDISNEQLRATLQLLVEKGWAKCLYLNKDEPIAEKEIDLINNYKQYAYLATKAGLMAHNGRI